MTEELERWRELEQSFYHVHEFEQKSAFDPQNDEVYYYGECECGETEI